MMNNIVKWVAAVALLLFIVAAISSCSSTRRLGCPMKITQSKAQVNWPVC